MTLKRLLGLDSSHFIANLGACSLDRIWQIRLKLSINVYNYVLYIRVGGMDRVVPGGGVV